MIPFDFAYYRPSTVEEAVQLYEDLVAKGNKPLYYGGGTEFISMARLHNIYADAVIDLKGIPECNLYETDNGELIIGAAVTLTAIAEANLFPLLSATVRRIADHTIQGKITLGGNLTGTIIYREAVLPLLVADAEVVIADGRGRRRQELKEVFHKRIKLAPGEMLVQGIVKNHYLGLQYVHAKRTKNEKIDYPLITLVGLNNNQRINLAFSGLCEYPLRSAVLEDIINQNMLPIPVRVDNAITQISGQITSNSSGSYAYRQFVLRSLLQEALSQLGVVS